MHLVETLSQYEDTWERRVFIRAEVHSRPDEDWTIKGFWRFELLALGGMRSNVMTVWNKEHFIAFLVCGMDQRLWVHHSRMESRRFLHAGFTSMHHNEALSLKVAYDHKSTHYWQWTIYSLAAQWPWYCTNIYITASDASTSFRLTTNSN